MEEGKNISTVIRRYKRAERLRGDVEIFIKMFAYRVVYGH